MASSKIRSSRQRSASSSSKHSFHWDGCLLLVNTVLNIPSLLYLLSITSKNSIVFSLSNLQWPISSIIRHGYLTRVLTQLAVEPDFLARLNLSLNSVALISYSYKGQVSGSCSSSGGVNIYVYRDREYLVTTCPVDGGRWISKATYRETYLVPDYAPETGEKIGEHEEVVYYTLPIEVQEGIKMFRYCKTITSYWEDVSQPRAEYEKAE